MTDFYQLLTGRPSPGRQSRRAFLRYANDGKNREEIERVGSRTQYRGEEPNPGARVQGERGRYEGRNGGPRVPEFPVGPGGLTGEPQSRALSEVIDTEPYGGDFVARLDEERRAALPSYLRANPMEDAPPPAPEGHAPRNPNNVIADAEGVTRRFDPTAEWKAAEERADARWREGRPTTVDTFIAMIYGRRVAEVEAENADMQDEITGRRPRR